MGPTTHITSLANLHQAFCIQMVDPRELFFAVDCSTDVPEHLDFDQHFPKVLSRKYENCTEWYKTNLATLGVQEPIVIIVRADDGRWQIDEGHHRLSWALHHDVPLIPVIFDDSGADDESNMAYLVTRANTMAYHNMEREELLAEHVTEPVFIPEQRTGRHRASGRHRDRRRA